MTKIAKAIEDDPKCVYCWKWGVRATPLVGLISLFTLFVGVEEPVGIFISHFQMLRDFSRLEARQKRRKLKSAICSCHLTRISRGNKNKDTFLISVVIFFCFFSAQPLPLTIDKVQRRKRPQQLQLQTRWTVEKTNGTLRRSSTIWSTWPKSGFDGLFEWIWLYVRSRFSSKTFVLSTIAYTAVIFVTGALTWY